MCLESLGNMLCSSQEVDAARELSGSTREFGSAAELCCAEAVEDGKLHVLLVQCWVQAQGLLWLM